MANYQSPNDPIARTGRPSLQAMSEALAIEAAHSRWHEEHPMEMCPPEFQQLNTYEDIERGDDMMRFGGGGTFEPGDAFVPRRGK